MGLAAIIHCASAMEEKLDYITSVSVSSSELREMRAMTEQMQARIKEFERSHHDLERKLERSHHDLESKLEVTLTVANIPVLTKFESELREDIEATIMQFAFSAREAKCVLSNDTTSPTLAHLFHEYQPGYPRVPGVYVKGAETQYNGFYRRRNKSDAPWAKNPQWRRITGPHWYDQESHDGCHIYWHSANHAWFLRKSRKDAAARAAYGHIGGRVAGQPALPAAQVADLAARPPAAEWICCANGYAAPDLTVQHFNLE